MGETIQKKVIPGSLFLGENSFLPDLYIISSKFEDENPKGWTDELVCRCNTASLVEVHISANPPIVYIGIFDDIYKKSDDVLLVLRRSHACNALCREGICLKESTNDLFRTRFEFALKECREPVFIKDDTCDCMWFGFSNGHVVIHFEKPRV